MVKLQKHKAYTYKSESGKEIEHCKHIVTIPESAISELGWSEGQQLTYTINDNVLIVRPVIEKEDGKK
jgi:hypothetical protein